MTHQIVLCLLVAYLGWRIYRRFRRNIGQQPFRPTPLKTSAWIFSLLSLGFLVLTRGHPNLMLGWLGGIVLGALLGVWSLRLTIFETTAEGRFYTPNGYIGTALSLLFVARLLYRVIAIYSHLSVAGSPPPAWGESALTFFTFELLAGYNVAYSIGVLRCPAALAG